jgi:hypothetical protein
MLRKTDDHHGPYNLVRECWSVLITRELLFAVYVLIIDKIARARVLRQKKPTSDVQIKKQSLCANNTSFNQILTFQT